MEKKEITQETGIKHRALCDNCVKEKGIKDNIVGKRWKCNVCADFDLCDSCYQRKDRSNVHDELHSFRQVKVLVEGMEDMYKTFIVDGDEVKKKTCL